MNQWLAKGEVDIIDLSWSRHYFDGHIAGAHFAIRSDLDKALAKLASRRASSQAKLVFTSEDGALAAYAANEHKAIALRGGNAAWRAAGFELVSQPTSALSEVEDIRLKAREQGGDIEAAMRAYLTWEINLVKDMASDDDQRFAVYVPNR